LGLLDNALGGATVRVETALTPAFDVSLAQDDGPPSVLLSLLRPRVTVLEGGAQVYSSAPYGEPSPPTLEVFRVELLLVGAVLAFGVYVLARRVLR
jgi:hypothetical protein